MTDILSPSRTSNPAGQGSGGQLVDIEPPGLHPALFSGYRDLAKLRYDYPLVLTDGTNQSLCLRSLSDIGNEVQRGIAHQGVDGERKRRHILRLEDEIRALVAGGNGGTLSELWDRAESNLLSHADEAELQSLKDSLSHAREALRCDGEVVDCDGAAPSRILTHVWTAVEETRARKFSEQIGELVLKLSNILKADSMKTGKAFNAALLKRSVGSSYEAAFNFDTMSEILETSFVHGALPDKKRQRIRAVLATLEAQKFVSPANGDAANGTSSKAHAFVFDCCSGALRAFRERLPEMVGLVKAMTVARLEIENRYKDAVHDPFFDRFGEDVLEPGDLASFPSYLVCLRSGATERADIAEILSAGLPIKILVQNDDILEHRSIALGRFSFGAVGSQLAAMALGLGNVYVLQSSSAGLYRLRDSILSGLTQDGPALFNVYSGLAEDAPGTPDYLRAAAATESRAFPTFVNDPARGGDRASRFSLAGNPQPEAGWPIHHFCYEDEDLQRIAEDTAFTFADFAATDGRYAESFTRVPRAEWCDAMVPVAEFLELDAADAAEKEPYILMIDDDDVLHMAVVEAKLIEAARRCRKMWRNLQELAVPARSPVEEIEAPTPETKSEPVPQGTKESTDEPAETPAVSTDEPHIETSRCTTCDECTQINNRMFAYNDNKQAYIADPDAGTYRDLVEAAESCQVAIIYPGKPRNADEPGLEDLIARAAAFG